MGQTLRFWGKSEDFPEYEVIDDGAIRKIDDDYQYCLPQFWGKLDRAEPQWLITLCDEEGKYFSVPVDKVKNSVIYTEGKYENR